MDLYCYRYFKRNKFFSEKLFVGNHKTHQSGYLLKVIFLSVLCAYSGILASNRFILLYEIRETSLKCKITLGNNVRSMKIKHRHCY